jgi:prepilin-type N-terminal cleavage/methylation domain-containing protein
MLKTQCHKSKIQRQNGFTFLELLIVLALVGIFFGLSVVAWNNVARQQERNRFPFALRWLMEEARQKAMTENMAVRIYFEWGKEGPGSAKSVSWIQLPCTREGGPLSKETCPAAPCQGKDINLNSCVPVSRSEKLPVPAGITLPGFMGTICFLGSSGSYSTDCKTEMSAPQGSAVANFGYMPMYVEGRHPYAFYVRTLSSYIEFLNCNNEEDAKTSTCIFYSK